MATVKHLKHRLDFAVFVNVDEVAAERINDHWPPGLIDGTFVASDLEDLLSCMGFGLSGMYKVSIEPME